MSLNGKILPATAVLLALLLGNIGLSSSSGQAGGNPCDLVASTVGLNANPGTLAQPVKTVQRLVDMLGPGQTGCLRGTPAGAPFNENVVFSNKNASGGSEANRIKLMSYPGEIAKIKGTVMLAESANFITISHLVMATYNPPVPLLRIDGDEIEIADNNISGSTVADCFRIGATAASPAFRTTITRNRIHDCIDGVSAVSTQGPAGRAQPDL